MAIKRLNPQLSDREIVKILRITEKNLYDWKKKVGVRSEENIKINFKKLENNTSQVIKKH